MPSNIAARFEFGHGDVEAGLKQADLVIERTYQDRSNRIRAISSPMPAWPAWERTGSGDIWCCTQGHFMVRQVCSAAARALTHRPLRVTASEIGGGFRRQDHGVHRTGGAGAGPEGQPSRQGGDEPVRGAARQRSDRVNIDRCKDRHDEGRDASRQADATLRYQGGAFPGSAVAYGAMAAFACYDLEGMCGQSAMT